MRRTIAAKPEIHNAGFGQEPQAGEGGIEGWSGGVVEWWSDGVVE